MFIVAIPSVSVQTEGSSSIREGTVIDDDGL